ncbi:MAG: glycosyltransferase [Magnetococcales bacterium]|nr:glycosyltransferase [Magnetococcales bacterium]
MMHVSVVVVCLNEEHHIFPCLESLLAQRYTLGEYEIVVVDGGSRDRTPEIVRAYTAMHPHVRLVTELRKGTAIGRNAGVSAARHPNIAFIDADCEAPPEWLERLATAFRHHRDQDQNVVAAGGGNVPPKDGPPFMQAVGVAMDSFAGSFNSAQGRRFAEDRQVHSLATLNVMYAKAAILAAGGFDVTLGSEAEDADLNHRLTRRGARLIFIPDNPVIHKFRPTPRIWYHNMVRYGRGRARLLKRHPEMRAWQFALPPVFLLGMATLLLGPLHPIFWSAALYFPAMLLHATLLCLKHDRIALVLHVTVVFIVQHFGYAIGEVTGLLDPKVL